MASSVANGCPLVPTHSGVPRLAVTPRVSGLERSQERSLDLPYPEPLSTPTPTSLSCLPSTHSVVPSLAEQINGPHLHHRPQERGGGSPRPKHKPFLTFPGRPSSNAYSMSVNGRCVIVSDTFVGMMGCIELCLSVIDLMSPFDVINWVINICLWRHAQVMVNING